MSEGGAGNHGGAANRSNIIGSQFFCWWFGQRGKLTGAYTGEEGLQQIWGGLVRGGTNVKTREIFLLGGGTGRERLAAPPGPMPLFFTTFAFSYF